MNIEPLEARIAPAILFKFLDVDGDLVTVAISKGSYDATTGIGDVTFTSAANVAGTPGNQLQRIDLEGKADVFAGANITITAKRMDSNGDGSVDVGFIQAGGVSLGSVSVAGDLGAIAAGVGFSTEVTLKSLTVASLGKRGTSTGASSLNTSINGQLGKLVVKGDLDGAAVFASAGIGSVSVGGDLIGQTLDYAGSIYTAGNLGPVTVKGNVIGSAGDYSGSIGAGLKTGTITLGDSLIGGSGTNSGRLYSGFITASDMGAVKIGHDVIGGEPSSTKTGSNTGVIYSPKNLASVSVGGSIRGNRGVDSGLIVADGDIGSVTIRGSLDAESADGAAVIAHGKMKSITIGGSIIGGTPKLSGWIGGDKGIDSVKIGGDLVGGGGEQSGLVYGKGDGLGSVSIGGSIFGGVGLASGVVQSSAGLAKLSVRGSIEGGVGPVSGAVNVVLNIGSLTVGGDLRGSSGPNSGQILAKDSITSAFIGGSIVGSSGFQSGTVFATKNLTKLTVGGSLIGGFSANSSGRIGLNTTVLGSLTIGGDVIGGDGPVATGGTQYTDAGSILVKRLGSVTIGGSIISGGGGTPITRSGGIAAFENIGAIVVKGSLVGTAGNVVRISARGLAGDPVEDNFAIKSLTVGGKVENASIRGGVDTGGGASFGDAQIGAVKIGGAWIASSLLAGVNVVNSIAGDGDDAALNGGTHSRIASIVIGGPVLGRAGTTDTFGFAAHEIGSFKYGGIAVALTAGAGNDTFTASLATSRAHAVGPSLSPATATKPDGFAVHVYEV